MKQLLNILLLNGLWLSTLVWAEVPNYDTDSGIVSFPQVTVNDKDKYINADLFLNPNGTWKILAYESEPTPKLDLTGNWSGTLNELYSLEWSPPIPCGPILSNISLFQEGSHLAGFASFEPNMCVTPSGVITGEINEGAITFFLEMTDNSKIIFAGFLDDKNNMVGIGRYKGMSYDGPWIFTLDNH